MLKLLCVVFAFCVLNAAAVPTDSLSDARVERLEEQGPRQVTAITDGCSGSSTSCSRNMVPAVVEDPNQCHATVRASTCCQNTQSSCCSHDACSSSVPVVMDDQCHPTVKASPCFQSTQSSCCSHQACPSFRAVTSSLDTSECQPTIRTSTCCQITQSTCCSQCDANRNLVSADVIDTSSQCHPTVRASTCCESAPENSCCTACKRKFVSPEIKAEDQCHPTIKASTCCQSTASTCCSSTC